MRAVLIETRPFSAWVNEAMTFEDYTAFQELLMKQPDCGSVIPGCGGLRKVRVSDARRGKGRRGGMRIVYLYFQEIKQFLLVVGYDKDQKTDLTPAERKALRMLADVAKEEARNKSLRA